MPLASLRPRNRLDTLFFSRSYLIPLKHRKLYVKIFVPLDYESLLTILSQMQAIALSYIGLLISLLATQSSAETKRETYFRHATRLLYCAINSSRVTVFVPQLLVLQTRRSTSYTPHARIILRPYNTLFYFIINCNALNF